MPILLAYYAIIMLDAHYASNYASIIGTQPLTSVAISQNIVNYSLISFG